VVKNCYDLDAEVCVKLNIYHMLKLYLLMGVVDYTFLDVEILRNMKHGLKT